MKDVVFVHKGRDLVLVTHSQETASYLVFKDKTVFQGQDWRISANWHPPMVLLSQD